MLSTMNISTMKTTALYSLIVCISAVMLTGCQKKPEISELFQSQILKLLESSTKLNAASSEGVSYRDFSSMLDDVNGAFELSKNMWPNGFAPNAKAAFEEAAKVWNFTDDLWVSKIKNSDEEGDVVIYESTYTGMSSEFKEAIPSQKRFTSPPPEEIRAKIAEYEQGRDNALNKNDSDTADIWRDLIKDAQSSLGKPRSFVDMINYSQIPACLGYASDKFEAARKELLEALN